MAKLSQKNQDQLITTGIWIGTGYIVFHYGGDAIKKFLASLNPFGNPAATNTVDQAVSDPNSAFSPKLWRAAPNGSALLTDFQAATYINQLLDSVDNILSYSNNFAQALGVFKAMKTQSQVSYLAEKFSQTQHQDLLSWLRNQSWLSHNFTDAQVSQIINYVSGLPKYKQ